MAIERYSHPEQTQERFDAAKPDTVDISSIPDRIHRAVAALIDEINYGIPGDMARAEGLWAIVQDYALVKRGADKALRAKVEAVLK
jgi:hypothetical protein